MTKPQAPIGDDELMAFIDGALSPDRRCRIEQLARHDDELAATITALRAQRKALRDSLDSVLVEPIPQRLLRVAPPSRYALQRVAAAMAWIAVGITVGSLASWQYLSRHDSTSTELALVNRAPDLPRFVHQATVAYAVFAPEVRHPVELGSAELQALNAWLSGRLGRHMRAPDLSSLGFSLVGGRLLPAETNKPAAQFMYEDRQGQRLTVYLRGMAQPTPETAFRYVGEGEISTFYWVERNWGYALSGELSRPQLLQAARSIYDQLST
ncbi:MAG TPA: anti-sigma factor [Thiobacillus sp.]|nr:anti-sigma factor [Thiobacillus sp.]HQT69040.1 anti-sigma factor [Thiobacillus sp.]